MSRAEPRIDRNIGFGSALIALYLRLVYATSRWSIENGEAVTRLAAEGKPFIIAFWHARMCAMPHVFRAVTRRTHVLISAHRDGEVIAQAIERLGFLTVRGSTAKRKAGTEKVIDKGGSAALRGMLRILKEGNVVAITPDGPRGPRMRASTGTATLAALSGVPMLCASFSSAPAIHFKSWDRFLLPLPFGHIRACVGEPLVFARDPQDPDFGKARRVIEDKLNALTQSCDLAAGQAPVEPAAESPGASQAFGS